eukprot:3675654-Prorocentrum_lima.AAC.1
MDKCECETGAYQHCPIVKNPHHTPSREHHLLHAQGNLTLLYLCSRQHPRLQLQSPAITAVVKQVQLGGSPVLLQHLDTTPRRHAYRPIQPER